MKLTNVARTSLEELRLDYEDYLRQRGQPQLAPSHPVLMRFKAKRCATLEEVQSWVAEELRRARTNTYAQGQSIGIESSVSVGAGPCGALSTPTLVANAALSLLNLACYLLDRQLTAQAAAFEREGGFTERLYRVRSAVKKGKP